jgi:hypothetical protein
LRDIGGFQEDWRWAMASGKPGPRTERGKAAVRLNPLKHGVLSQTPVIPLVEREEDWLRLRRGIFEYFGAEGMMEEALADQVASLIWRRYRLVRFETESIAAYVADVPEDLRRLSEDVGERAAAEMERMVSARLMPGAETAEKIMRYETRLHKFLLQTIHQLLVLQALRVGSGRPPSTEKEVRLRRLRPDETKAGSVAGLPTLLTRGSGSGAEAEEDERRG